jgi:hypothetical protein
MGPMMGLRNRLPLPPIGDSLSSGDPKTLNQQRGISETRLSTQIRDNVESRKAQCQFASYEAGFQCDIGIMILTVKKRRPRFDFEDVLQHATRS